MCQAQTLCHSDQQTDSSLPGSAAQCRSVITCGRCSGSTRRARQSCGRYSPGSSSLRRGTPGRRRRHRCCRHHSPCRRNRLHQAQQQPQAYPPCLQGQTQQGMPSDTLHVRALAPPAHAAAAAAAVASDCFRLPSLVAAAFVTRGPAGKVVGLAVAAVPVASPELGGATASPTAAHTATPTAYSSGYWAMRVLGCAQTSQGEKMVEQCESGQQEALACCPPDDLAGFAKEQVFECPIVPQDASRETGLDNARQDSP